MTKVKLTYIGTHDDATTEIDAFGHSFVKGEPLAVDKDSLAYRKLSANPTFVDSGDEGHTALIATAKKEAKEATKAEEA